LESTSLCVAVEIFGGLFLLSALKSKSVRFEAGFCAKATLRANINSRTEGDFFIALKFTSSDLFA
jgi:hypothetical protein